MIDWGFWSAVGEFAKPIAVGLAAYGGAALVAWNASRKKNKPHRPFEVIYREDLEITVILDRVLHRLGAIRVYLAQYHNGDAYLGGPDIIRKSRTHERVRTGMSYQHEEFRGVLVSTIPEESKLVIEEGASWTELKDIPNSKFKWMLVNAGVKATARCAVKIKGRTVGFVGADFDVTEMPEEIESICKDAEAISHIISIA